MSDNQSNPPPTDTGATPAKGDPGFAQAGTTAPAKRTPDEWAAVRGLRAHQLAAVRALANANKDKKQRWPEGKTVTEDEFNQACNDAFAARHR